MSMGPMLWAMDDAPTRDLEEWAILVTLAEKADADGCNAYQSQRTLAKRTKLDVRTVARRLKDMESREGGPIRRGDQRVVAHLPADKRPVVYDLQIPFSWFRDREEVQRYREERGRLPMTPETRPDLPPAPPKKTRADKGARRAKKHVDNLADSVDNERAEGVEAATGLQVTPTNEGISTGLQDRPDYKSTATCLQVHGDMSTSQTTLGFDSSLDLRRTPPTSSTAAIDDSAGQEEEKISSPRSNPAKPDGWPELTEWETALHAELMALRPDWSARTLRKVLGSDVIRERTDRDLVRAAFLFGARTSKTTTPNRLLHEHCPHWTQAYRQLHEHPQTAAATPAKVIVEQTSTEPSGKPHGRTGPVTPPPAAYLAAREAARPKTQANRQQSANAFDRLREATTGNSEVSFPTQPADTVNLSRDDKWVA